MNHKLSSRNKKAIAALFFFFVLFSLALFVFLLSTNKIRLAYNNDYQPDQPIPFSHAIHVGQYQMDCRYCHTAVEEGRHAGVPSLDICMNCHLTVKPDSPYIQKLVEAYGNNQPIVWEKVHLLPDFVKFNHSLHIKALSGRFSQTSHLPPSGDQVRKTCTTCHGKVENMKIMYQHESLSMGWCVQCHRKEESKAPIDCSTCHY
ncbi:MAG: cytochrome c3 family protein [Bdellovibrionales bacterium]|nr:cytochrome c3 family protein [Bdellovibrionales bacterium]